MQSRFLVLAHGPGGGAVVDLETGALFRTYYAGSVGEPLARYDVIEARVAADQEIAFAADSRVISGVRRVGRLRGRRAERYLKALVHPDSLPLLGFPAPIVPFWTLNDDRPSLAIVAPAAGPVIERDKSLRLHCRFRWRRFDHDLPLHDDLVAGAMAHPTADRLAGTTLERALGWKPRRLLVALTPPRDGQCHKVVAALLPRP